MLLRRPLVAALISTLLGASAFASEWSAWAPAQQAGLRWEGRVRFDERGTAIYDWAQVSLHARFTGDRLAIYADVDANYLDLSVDGKLKAVLGPQPKVSEAPMLPLWHGEAPDGPHVYAFKGFGPGVHRLLIAKRTGPNVGIVQLKGFRLAAQGSFLPAPPAASRSIEVLGDSLSVGYGDQGASVHCAQLSPYEDSSVAWPRLLASDLGAEAQVLAYSGYGVVRNYGEKSPASSKPFPVFYPRTVLAEKEGPLWDRDAFQPQVVVCLLGSNDYSTKPVPEPSHFIDGYRRLLAQAREGRGKLPVLCLYPKESPQLAEQIRALVAEEQAAGLPTQAFGLATPRESEMGCNGHPKATVHQRWARSIEPKLREMMKWPAT